MIFPLPPVALGCVQPELPKNVVLVEYNPDEGLLRVVCEHPDFVFPDTSFPERMLRCSPTHVAWDRTIPSCIGKNIFKIRPSVR